MSTSEIEVEQAFLGCLLFDDTALSTITVNLEPAHFYEPFHQMVFDKIRADAAVDVKADPFILSRYFAGNEAFERLGGRAYLMDVYDKAPPSNIAPQYAKEIVTNWQLREVRESVKIVASCNDPTQIMDTIKREVERIEAHDVADDDMQGSDEIASEFFDKMTQIAKGETTYGLKTGIVSFDDVVGGFVAGDLIVAGGQSSMGKTMTARSIFYSAAPLHPDYVFPIYSMEMPKDQIIARAISEIAYHKGVKIPYKQYREASFRMVEDLIEYKYLLPSNVKISSRKRLHVSDIERSARKLKREHGKIGAILIDHLHEMLHDENSRDPFGETVGRLKALCDELGTTMLLLSQLTKNNRENKRPILADLKQSGAIGEKADVVLFPFREYQILKDEKPRRADEMEEWKSKLEALKHKLTAIYAKVRNGEVCDREMWCHPAFDTIRDLPPASSAWDEV